MAYIVDFFSTRTDKGLQIGNEEFLRTLSIGTNWQKIRVGVRLGIQGTGNITGVSLVFGVCAGTSGYKSNGTVEYVGAHFGNVLNNSTFTYTIAAPPYYTVGSTSFPNVTVFNGVATLRGGASQTSYLAANLLTTRTGMYLDITKGTPYSLTTYNPASIANVQTDITQSLFIQAMETDGTPANITSPASVTYTHPGAGLMDTVSVAWMRSTPALTIFDVAVARIL